jgi:site-specific DNA-methyltransferase (adenine-specific)
MSTYDVKKQDAFKFLSKINSQTVDLVITDPPYESLEKYRKIGTTTRLKKQWFDIVPNSRFEELFSEIYRVLKNNTHFYLFCDQETMFVAKPIAEKVGFKFWKPIVWDKINIGMGYHYRSRYEFILFFEKGKRKIHDLSMPDILPVKRITNKYPTQKPVALLQLLICQSTNDEEIVCDPFMGSGTSCIAAIRDNRGFIGCDKSELAFNTTIGRMILEELDEKGKK